MSLFTRVRGSGILRSSSNPRSKKFAKKISNITHMRDALCKLFGLEVLGEGGWLKTLTLAEYAPRKAPPGSLQQSLLPYHEAWS